MNKKFYLTEEIYQNFKERLMAELKVKSAELLHEALSEYISKRGKHDKEMD